MRAMENSQVFLANFKGKQLKKARQYRGMDLADLSEATGLFARLLSDYECGLTLPDVEHVFAFVRVLQFPLLHFFVEPKIKVEIGTAYWRNLY